MPPTLTKGQLVSVNGSEQMVGAAEGWANGVDAVPRDRNGEMGQLTEFDESTKSWNVATFGATMVTVKEEDLKPLTSDDVQDFDIALGPASQPAVMGSELTNMISRQGHCLCKLFVAPEDLTSMGACADRSVDEGAFSRLAGELEPGYLGTEGTGKTLAIDMDSAETAAHIKDSPIRIVEEAFSTVGQILRPYVEEELGFDVYSRTNTLLALPFNGDEDQYLPPDLENEDTANFLAMMWRAKLQVVVNAGPNPAKLTLYPKSAGDAETILTVKAGMLAVFSVERFRFSYKAEGKALMMSCWFLDRPAEYQIDNLIGDFTEIVGGGQGAKPPSQNQISVVSMSTRYAFGVDEPWKLWSAYSKAGWDTMIRHPFQRWDCDIYYEEGADQTTGKSYTCHGGFSDGIELFDCKFFDISPAEAKGMDPTQRQVLEVSYISLQGAGWTKKQLQQKPAQIACFVGLDKNEWNSIPKDISGGFGASSSANAITSNRFNYCMNLKGASMTIDTACSSSLVCLHTGKLYLLHKHYDPCEAVIDCGVNLSISPLTYIGGCGAGMHSHLGRCFTYNFSADGYARGEATAACALKLRAFDKEAGDYCLCAGSQVNQDGRSASLTAPNGPSQERCNSAVIKEIGIKAPEIDTTECHGTGTSLGDPIEIGAYRKVMAATPRHELVTITSSKSNIGHCEGSAGISGFLKCVLMCMNAEGTPNAHFSCLNPHLDMDGFPGVITTEGVTFRNEASYNSVLSFGFGGTNACAMAWGTNIMTSRGMASKDMYELVLQKMITAPQQDVTITGEDWEDWEMGGPERDAKPGDSWEVEFDEDGAVTYYKKEKESPDLGNSYFLTGSFNDWGFDSLEASTDAVGLYIATVTLGDSGEENFQVVADQEAIMTFYPEMPHCSIKSAPIAGPAKAAKEFSWLIRGQPGDKYRVEFYRSEADTVSLSWIREK